MRSYNRFQHPSLVPAATFSSSRDFQKTIGQQVGSNLRYTLDMPIILLTGPAASGKNTISHQLAMKIKPSADIDVDLVRWMYRNPHYAPWDGEEGIEQMKLGVVNACLLAESFDNNGLTVFLTDVVLSQTINVYKKKLAQHELTILQLLPSSEVCMERLHSREHTISDSEAEWVYKSQEQLEGFDFRLDTSELSVDQAVEKVRELLTK